MLVVSDTSPLRGLSAIGKLELVPALYSQVVIPPAVLAELSVPLADFPPITLDRCPFLILRSPADSERVVELRTRVDAGEAEAIALAIEIGADALLIDEIRGRKVAAEFGLSQVGVLGVLAAAKRAGFVPAIRPLAEDLKNRFEFRIGSGILAQVLRDAGE